jgi:hypothetical protein
MSVSVVMRCRDEERTIEEAVRSVEAQTIFDSVEEIIVVDDGSRDGSRVVLERLDHEIDKLTVIQTPGLGAPVALNRAVREASGEFVAILDGDDFWTPQKLERQLPAFRRGANIGLVYGDFVDFSAMTRRTAGSSRCADSTPKALTSFAIILCTTGRSCRPRLSFAARFSTTSASSMNPPHWSGHRVLPAGRHKVAALSRAGRFHLQASPSRPDHGEARRCATERRSGNAAVRFTPLRAQVTCGPPNGSDPRKGQRRLCDEGEWRKALHHHLCAIRLAPLYWRAWANLVLLLAPASVVRPCYEAIKRPWHALRQSWHSAPPSS